MLGVERCGIYRVDAGGSRWHWRSGVSVMSVFSWMSVGAVELFNVVVSSTVGLPRAKRISILEMGCGSMVVAVSKVCARGSLLVSAGQKVCARYAMLAARRSPWF